MIPLSKIGREHLIFTLFLLVRACSRPMTSYTLLVKDVEESLTLKSYSKMLTFSYEIDHLKAFLDGGYWRLLTVLD